MTGADAAAAAGVEGLGRGAGGDAGVRTYYGTPVLKEPEWTWEVPWYLFSGGLAGASSAARFVARRTGHHRTADRLAWVGAGALVANPVLLISDLGRPGRFFNMLRVFKPTSAMNMGSWLLALYSTVAGAERALGVVGRAPRLRVALSAVEGALGLPMATYTGVLLADSSIPVWHEARHHLPGLFAASAGASAGAAALLVAPADEAAAARRLALGGAAAELVGARVMRRRLGPVGAVYGEGGAQRYERAATACTAAGAVLVALGRRRRAPSVAGAALLLAGGVCQRWAVFRAGFQSAADPVHVVAPQRERVERRGGGATS